MLEKASTICQPGEILQSILKLTKNYQGSKNTAMKKKKKKNQNRERHLRQNSIQNFRSEGYETCQVMDRGNQNSTLTWAKISVV